MARYLNSLHSFACKEGHVHLIVLLGDCAGSKDLSEASGSLLVTILTALDLRQPGRLVTSHTYCEISTSLSQFSWSPAAPSSPVCPAALESGLFYGPIPEFFSPFNYLSFALHSYDTKFVDNFGGKLSVLCSLNLYLMWVYVLFSTQLKLILLLCQAYQWQIPGPQ